jgi:hypothetical protein
VVGTPFCTHGPDDRSAGARRASIRAPRTSTIDGPLPEAVACDGDGTSGKRVQAVYARTADAPDRYAEVLPDLRRWAAGVQATFLTTAARTDGLRRPRWVTDDACRLDVVHAVLSEEAAGTLGRTITELSARGHGRTDRKYLVWFDASTYCGIATIWSDDRARPDNANETRTGYARVDAGCWGWAESHEVMHLLGAVQDSAPHSTYRQGGYAHCSDEYDVMCYVDRTGVVMTITCEDTASERQYDCGNDDYFHTHPVPGSYLATYWNTADSGWLGRFMVALVPPSARLADGATLHDRGIPVVVRYATAPPLSGVERVVVQHEAGDAQWERLEVEPDGTAVQSAMVAGPRHRFRVRARAGSDPPSAWLTSPRQRFTLRDDAHDSLVWSGGWTSVASGEAWGVGAHRSRSRGATLTFRIRGLELGVVARTGPDAGRIAVLVDGTRVATLDLSAQPAGPRRIVFTRRLAPGRAHTVRLRHLGASPANGGDLVEIDAILRAGR